jgi:hypothetical protein
MALFRREKSWTLGQTDVPAVRASVLAVLSPRGIRVSADGGSGPIEGRAGSGLTSLLVWNERTAPYRVRVNVSEAPGAVLVEAAVEEGSQAGMVGPKKARMYSKIADGLFDDLQDAFAQFVSPVAGTSPVGTVLDATEQIGRLAELRDSGALTDDEFEAKKKELLGRI